MPRQPHKDSKTGVYHVMMRGINRQYIFLDEDRYRFLDTKAGISYRDFFMQVIMELKSGRTDYENILPMTISQKK